MGVLASVRVYNGGFRAASRSRLLTYGYIRRRGLSGSASEHHGKDSVLPVLIVGAGPVGLVLSIFLTKLGTLFTPLYPFPPFDSYLMLVFDLKSATRKLEEMKLHRFLVVLLLLGMVSSHFCALCTFPGVKCAVLEKNKSFSTHPQAHFINNRSMEVRDVFQRALS